MARDTDQNGGDERAESEAGRGEALREARRADEEYGRDHGATERHQRPLASVVDLFFSLAVGFSGFAVGVVASGLGRQAQLDIPFPIDFDVDDQWVRYRIVPAGRDLFYLDEERALAPDGYFHYATVTEPGELQTRWVVYMRDREDEP